MTASPRPIPSERFQRVLAFASDEADGLGHGFVTCQHLLYALARERKGMACAVLESLGVHADDLHGLLADSAAPHDRIEGRIDLADEMREVLNGAFQAAQEWNHRSLDTEHLLYGILSAATSADEMFSSLGINPTSVMSKLHQMQRVAPTVEVRDEAAHAYRFTVESAWLLSLATDTARRYGAPEVSSLHLLGAMISLASPVRDVLVESFDLTSENIWRHLGTYAENPSRGRLPLSEEVQRILGYAIGEAWNRGHIAITPLHLAMGFARAERHTALDLLADLGVSQADLAEAVAAAMPPPTTR